MNTNRCSVVCTVACISENQGGSTPLPLQPGERGRGNYYYSTDVDNSVLAVSFRVESSALQRIIFI